MDKKFTFNASNLFPDTEFDEANDPRSQCLVHSIMDIGEGFQVDVVARVIDELPAVESIGMPGISAYVNMGARIGWEYKFITLSVAGQNLLYDDEPEFGTRSIPRSIYANIKIRL